MNTKKGYDKQPTRLFSRQLVDFAIKQVLDMRSRRGIKNLNPEMTIEPRERKSHKGILRTNKLSKILAGAMSLPSRD